MTATFVVLPPDAPLAQIAMAAGAADFNAYSYNPETGRLSVLGVTQAALDAAVASVGTAPVGPPVPPSVALWRARAALAEAGLIEA